MAGWIGYLQPLNHTIKTDFVSPMAHHYDNMTGHTC